MAYSDPGNAATTDSTSPRLRAGLVRNLASGFALLGLRRLSPEHFVRSFDQLLVLLLLNLLVWAGLDSLHAEAGSQLALDAVYGWAFYLLAGLIGCALVARAQSRETDTRALLVPALAVSPYVLVLLWLLGDVPEVSDRPVVALLVAAAYLSVLGLRVLGAAYGRVRARAAVVAILLIVAAPWVMASFDLDTRLWLTDEPEETQPDDSDATESILYDQPARIAAAVERVAPRSPGKAGVFFLGFAGYGEQGIFKREALFAEQIFADRMGSGERSVQLINDDEDRDSYPLATVSGLQQALKLMASRMDTEEDILVLMLTSHGSAEGLAVSNGTLPLLQLGPADLRQVLDESGIKWRVVVVSACYAGVFLDALKNDTTLVVTAADAEHSSFGCDENRDLTYFGEAFLRDSLPAAASVEDAFKNATVLIRRREAAERKIHSNPQLFVGPRIHDKLNGLMAAPGAPPAPRRRDGETQTVLGTIPVCPRQNTQPQPVPCRYRS
jgi:hypothetical protein